MNIMQEIVLIALFTFLGVSFVSWLILPFILSKGLESIKNVIEKLGDK